MAKSLYLQIVGLNLLLFNKSSVIAETSTCLFLNKERQKGQSVLFLSFQDAS